jgi:hypothetical protein
VTLVLAVRTREGHYLEFTTVRADLENGDTIAIELEDAVFAQLLDVPTISVDVPPENTNGKREPAPTIISGAGNIKSQEDVRGIG